MIDTNVAATYIAYFDGACEPINPGGTASYGAVIFHEGEIIWECSKVYVCKPEHEKETSNNVAEYAGLIAVPEGFANQGLFNAEICIRGDRQLVIHQMFGTWKIKKGLYVPLGL